MAKKDTTAKTMAVKAKEIAEANGVSVVYANSKGEFFTVKNYALNSEKDKKNVQTFDFGNAVEDVEEIDKIEAGDE
ncbi:hypothetical protein FACS1894169_01020 [Bacteroidia bacterium]|nr:hypothetical protein FACS1894169_01020 [Bacteroidia bacterium]